MHTFVIDVIKTEVPGLPVPANQVDDQVGVLHGLSEAVLIVDAVRGEEDLTKVSIQLQTLHIVSITPVGQDELSACVA